MFEKFKNRWERFWKSLSSKFKNFVQPASAKNFTKRLKNDFEKEAHDQNVMMVLMGIIRTMQNQLNTDQNADVNKIIKTYQQDPASRLADTAAAFAVLNKVINLSEITDRGTLNARLATMVKALGSVNPNIERLVDNYLASFDQNDRAAGQAYVITPQNEYPQRAINTSLRPVMITRLGASQPIKQKAEPPHNAFAAVTMLHNGCYLLDQDSKLKLKDAQQFANDAKNLLDQMSKGHSAKVTHGENNLYEYYINQILSIKKINKKNIDQTRTSIEKLVRCIMEFADRLLVIYPLEKTYGGNSRDHVGVQPSQYQPINLQVNGSHPTAGQNSSKDILPQRENRAAQSSYTSNLNMKNAPWVSIALDRPPIPPGPHSRDVR